MPRSERVLYAAFLRLFRQFRTEGIPLTGVVGSNVAVADGRPLDLLRAQFRQQGSYDRGLRLLSQLKAQLDTLVGSEEETREALAEWERLLAGQHAGGATGSAAAAAAALAAERGMELLAQQSRRLDELFCGSLGLEEEAEELEEDFELLDDGGGETGGEPPTLGSLAAEVQERYAQMAAAVGGGSNAELPPAAAAAGALQPEEQLLLARALAEVLYGRYRYRYRPFEWVYEGLKPLLLPDVLRRRRGAPLSLAVLVAAVGRRVGLALTPIPAADPLPLGPPAAGAAGPDGQLPALAALPPHLAGKLSSSAQQGALPVQQPWLLWLEPPGGGAELGGCYCMDAATGELLGPEELAAKYPALDLSARGGWSAVWRALVRTIVQAHQRRGESDLVAHWMYVAMALDPDAEEWGLMLGQRQ